ncbi:unnamed protein product, partial [Dibothriocephalus latus]
MLGLPAEPVENKKAVPHLRGLIAAVHLPRGLILGCVDVLCLDCLLLPLLSRRPELHPLLQLQQQQHDLVQVHFQKKEAPNVSLP